MSVAGQAEHAEDCQVKRSQHSIDCALRALKCLAVKISLHQDAIHLARMVAEKKAKAGSSGGAKTDTSGNVLKWLFTSDQMCHF